ncbi:FAD/NAD(P)-binding domain-containing protein [Lophiostoma macrostomum CBS 122681]|uniref:FAD/NAD(P)-binding domain-containing protein n=1 Tax=Lophiostoma macrostomum CBS 122681 TaxID=1314788 RepID=A0A6A6SQB8_9PLEO|nr:FAD/NAD(P)-binding domain-containing protein [Lophiostoma macrostomum CBS 122681]
MATRRYDGTYDVVIVGAGISGINAAYHLQTKLPGLSYTILEARTDLGGTWDLFRYPGIRSDTDLQSFGFSWYPWMEKRAIADGSSIVRYLRNAAKSQDITNRIQFDQNVVSAAWSSADQCWSLAITNTAGIIVEYQARFLILGTGYYDYKTPLKPEIPGLKQFSGQVVHPQFWPANLDYTDKEVVIIGSGATAITLLPSLAQKSKQVTMLQRSPGYIISIDNATGGSWLHRVLPALWSFKLTRWLCIWTTLIVFHWCRAFPRKSRTQLQQAVATQLPDRVPINPHFQPLYAPWDQRVCFSPNGDFFQAIREGNANVVTDRVVNMERDYISLASGHRLRADIIVTATGLNLKIGSSIKFSVDGETIDIASKTAWRSAMLSDVPNLAFVVGYVNASWTLGADVTAQLVCRLLKHLEESGKKSAVPRMPKTVRPQLLWDLDATYIKEAQKNMPSCGDSGPWRGRTNYFYDLWRAKVAKISDDLELS